MESTQSRALSQHGHFSGYQAHSSFAYTHEFGERQHVVLLCLVILCAHPFSFSGVSVGDVDLMGGMGLGLEVSARSMYCPGASWIMNF